MSVLAVRYLGGFLAFLAFCVALIAYGEHRRQLEWDTSIAQQAMQAAETVIKEAENTARIDTKYERTKQAQAQRVRTVEKEVIQYVESPDKKCGVSPELEKVFDAISAAGGGTEPDPPAAPAAGVPDPATNGLPTSASAASELLAPPDTGLTDAEILQAYDYAAKQYYALRLVYRALAEWEETSSAIAKEGAGR